MLMNRDDLAYIIASAIWRPDPAMSGDMWDKIGPLRKRDAEHAADAVRWEIAKQTPDAATELLKAALDALIALRYARLLHSDFGIADIDKVDARLADAIAVTIGQKSPTQPRAQPGQEG